MRIAKDGWGIIAAVALAAAVAWAMGWHVAAWTLVALAAGVAYFFRDPERQVPAGDGLVVSPADGKVVGIAPHPESDAGDQIRVSIFLSLFDVHVNRSPLAGRVTGIDYHPGAFLPAFQDKASLKNEQNHIGLNDGSRDLKMVQIAGLVARRIVCRAREGDWLERGQRLGLIKFGSRVDLYLPRGIELRVNVGDRVRGGSSVIGRLTDGPSASVGDSGAGRPRPA